MGGNEKKRRFIFTTTLALGALSAHGAAADFNTFFGINPFPISQYQTAYMSIGGGFLFRQMPKFNGTQTISGQDEPLFQSNKSVLTGGGGFTIGFRLDRLGVGDKPRMEIAFGGWTGSSRETGGSGVFPLTVFHSIDGQRSFNCGFCDSTTDIKVRLTELGGTLRLKTDFRVAPKWTVTPLIGFVGSRTQTKYETNSLHAFEPTGGLPGFTKQTVTASRFGGELGTDIAFQATPRFSVQGGVAIAFLAVRTSMKGNDCEDSDTIIPAECKGTIYRTSVSDSDSRFAIRVSLSLTGAYDAGWIKISLTGFGGLDNAMPGVRNPASGTVAPTGPAQIVYESRWTYGGAVLATFPFFR